MPIPVADDGQLIRQAHAGSNSALGAPPVGGRDFLLPIAFRQSTCRIRTATETRRHGYRTGISAGRDTGIPKLSRRFGSGDLDLAFANLQPPTN